MSEKRYSLVIPQDQWDKVKEIAEREGLPISVLIRRFVDLGLIAGDPSARLILKIGGQTKRLRMFRKDDDDNVLALN